MELTTLKSPISTDKKINLKRANNNSPVISNSNTKVTNFMIAPRPSSPDPNNPKPNQVGKFMRKNVLINSDKRKEVSETFFIGIFFKINFPKKKENKN